MEIQEDSKVINAVGNKYYKILNEEMKHNGYQYQLGLNVDIYPLNKKRWCARGGLHISTFENIYRYFKYGVYVAEIELPADAVVLIKDGDIKVDKIIIKNIIDIKNFDELWGNEELCIKAVKEDKMSLRYVKEQTEKICLAAVKNDGDALRYVKKQTEEICIAAVKNNGDALRYVKKQTKEICLAAIEQNMESLRFVGEEWEELYEYAIEKDPLNIQYIHDPSHELCISAIYENAEAVEHVPWATNSMMTVAVCTNPNIIEKWKELEDDEEILYLLAVYLDPSTIKHVEFPTRNMHRLAHGDEEEKEYAKKQALEKLKECLSDFCGTDEYLPF